MFHLGKKSDKQIELTEMLEEEQFKSGMIIESITDGVIITDSKGTVQLLNNSAAKMLGWQQSDALRLNYQSLIHPTSEKDDAPIKDDALSQSLATGKPTQKVSLLETHNQRHIYVDIVASPIQQTLQIKGNTQQHTVGTIAVLRDVDQQKRSEQQRSDFISTASHEMRTPVASIQGYLELALNPKISQLDEKAQGFLEKAYDATKHLGQLFQDLLTVSQTEDGRLSNHPAPVDIRSLLIAMCDEFTQRAKNKNLILQCNLETSTMGEKTISPPMNVMADIERLREVIANILENAIKYTSEGKVTVDGTIKEDEDSVVISINDTGPGIAEEDIAHLFQKFYRVDNSATREIGGTGLGLYISRQIIELFDGKIWAESKLGTGSTFFIELPRVNPDSPTALTRPLEPMDTATQAISEKI